MKTPPLTSVWCKHILWGSLLALLFFTTPVVASSTVAESYAALPTVELTLLGDGDSVEFERNLFARRGEYVGKGDRIEISGSKGVGLKLSSGSGLGVVQSLDVALSGELASGLRFEGVLSDQDLPVTVAGTTAELDT